MDVTKIKGTAPECSHSYGPAHARTNEKKQSKIMRLSAMITI